MELNIGLNFDNTPIIELLLYIFGLIVIVISTINGLIRSIGRLILFSGIL